ncbi:RES family NAD+ phosphorylase [Catalinimonas sp. 4WD22]|uniref:RES family NAD+ phosphorylase n=1 Tax=Catalinimonas locisalis TaxID=3133978 RepID=UPI0031018BEA
MLLYRIIFAKYAESKFAPGDAGRWNEEGQRVLYTSTSPALAMSETMAHRLGQGFLSAGYSLITFEVDDNIAIEEIKRSQLPEDWRLYSSYSISQPLGSAWFKRQETLLLRVPSAVVPNDYNVVVNATHPDYDLLKEISREAFPFDDRFIQADQELKESRTRQYRKNRSK